MILLSVDTSGLKGSLALTRVTNGVAGEVRQCVWTKKAMHSEIATVKLEELLAQAGVTLRELTHLAVNVGPGSFTGLRVGLSLVRTLAYALSLPVVELNSLEVQAFTHAKLGEKIFVANKAVQTFYYAAAFERSQIGVTTTLSPRSAEESELATLAQGCRHTFIEGKTPDFSAATEAKDLVSLLAASGFSKTFSDWKAVEPLYLRASEAEEKLKKGLLKPV